MLGVYFQRCPTRKYFVGKLISTTLQNERIYLDSKYNESNELIKRGGKYDPELKKWYTTEKYQETFRKWIRTYLDSHLIEKHQLESNGARWDPINKSWFVLGKIDNSFIQKYVSNDPYKIALSKCPFKAQMETNKYTFKSTSIETDRSNEHTQKPLESSFLISTKSTLLTHSFKTTNSPFKSPLTSSTNFQARSLSPPPSPSSGSFPNSPFLSLSTNYTEHLSALTTTHSHQTKKLLIFDTETSGLPTRLNNDTIPSYYDLDVFSNCRLVQFSYLVCNSKFEIIKPIQDFIVQAHGFEITNSHFHGISQEKSLSEGISLALLFKTIREDFFQNSNIIIAHNADFDMNVLRSELWRAGMKNELTELEKSQVFCSMKELRVLIGAKNKVGKLKSPNLKELYQFATSTAITNQHDSKYDVLNLHQALQSILSKKLFKFPF